VGIKEHKEIESKIVSITPNPFYNRVNIGYNLENGSNATLSIYDTSGNLIKVLVDKRQSAGHYTLSWNGRDRNGKAISRGTYLLILKTGRKIYKEKLIRM